MSRRSAVQCGCALFVLAFALWPAALRAERRPNIVFLFSDDQRADAVGAYGNTHVRTPNVDRLAERGFRFEAAYVMGGHHGAICAPSRAMLMSGRSLFRVYENLDPVATFPQMLGRAGYATFATGKWHNSRTSFEKGFQQGRNVFFGGMGDHDHLPMEDLRPEGGFTAPVMQGFSTTRFVDAAVAFIERHAAAAPERPFLAYVAFTAPHDPRTPPDEYLARYPPEAVPLPPNFRPVHPFDLGPETMAVRDEHLAAWPRTPDVVRAQIAEYYALVEQMDVQIGRILQALERTGQLQHTIVVFASDNGLALGSHGLLGKQSLYEHSTRVPLVLAGPGIPRGTSDALVYLFDLAPTLYALTGVAGPDGMDGHDLSPVWRRERPRVRETLFTAYVDAQRAVRDEGWKLIRYPGLHHTQLFDLRTDPYELRDLAGDPAQQERVATMLRWLEDWQRRTGDPHPLTAAVRRPMAFDPSRIERKPDQWQPPRVLDKYFRP